MSVAAARTRFAHALETELSLIHQFVELLERERAALVATETDVLLTLAETKTELYRKLQLQHRVRADILSGQQLDNTDADIRTLCAGMPETLARWNDIIKLATDAHARNELNGKLITEHMQHNQSALSVLMAAAEQPLYDAEGATRPAGRGRHLGSA